MFLCSHGEVKDRHSSFLERKIEVYRSHCVEIITIELLDNARKRLQDAMQIAGSFDRAILPLRDIVSAALAVNAHAIRLTHNHPSGDPRPSRADLMATRQVVQVLKPIGIRVDDHVILGDPGYFSFREAGLL